MEEKDILCLFNACNRDKTLINETWTHCCILWRYLTWALGVPFGGGGSSRNRKISWLYWPSLPIPAQQNLTKQTFWSKCTGLFETQYFFFYAIRQCQAVWSSIFFINIIKMLPVNILDLWPKHIALHKISSNHDIPMFISHVLRPRYEIRVSISIIHKI